MDAKTIGDLTGKYHGTIIISTPTFYSSYVRKIQPEQFAHLRYPIVGAEKLRPPIAAAFKDRFGLDLIEGYGCTEMAPVVAVNMPEPRVGSVGRPIPGVSARVVAALALDLFTRYFETMWDHVDRGLFFIVVHTAVSL
jgi:acyl-[acyl-carrier-protein]-phospholipid O-acyltransferase/long-chain-fatty-acid--[acyl-carrier-protein] ligase